MLSTNERKRRNKQNAERVKKNREKKKNSGFASRRRQHRRDKWLVESNLTATGDERQLIVRMNFSSSKKGSARKRISRAVTKAHREIKKLKAKNDEMKKED